MLLFTGVFAALPSPCPVRATLTPRPRDLAIPPSRHPASRRRLRHGARAHRQRQRHRHPDRQDLRPDRAGGGGRCALPQGIPLCLARDTAYDEALRVLWRGREGVCTGAGAHAGGWGGVSGRVVLLLLFSVASQVSLILLWLVRDAPAATAGGYHIPTCRSRATSAARSAWSRAGASRLRRARCRTSAHGATRRPAAGRRGRASRGRSTRSRARYAAPPLLDLLPPDLSAFGVDGGRCVFELVL